VADRSCGDAGLSGVDAVDQSGIDAEAWLVGVVVATQRRGGLELRRVTSGGDLVVRSI
jgi:hypothetical protein